MLKRPIAALIVVLVFVATAAGAGFIGSKVACAGGFSICDSSPPYGRIDVDSKNDLNETHSTVIVDFEAKEWSRFFQFESGLDRMVIYIDGHLERTLYPDKRGKRVWPGRLSFETSFCGNEVQVVLFDIAGNYHKKNSSFNQPKTCVTTSAQNEVTGEINSKEPAEQE